MKKLLILIVMILMMSMVACSPEEVDNVTEEKMIIAVSIVPQETFVKAVVGDNFDIVTLIPPGYSPENHEPKAETMAKLERASLYFAIGVPTEDVNILPYLKDTKVVTLHTEAALYYPDREFEPGFKSRFHYKDLNIIMDTAKSLNVPLPATAIAHELFSAMMASGRGELDHSAVINIIEDLAKVQARSRE